MATKKQHNKAKLLLKITDTLKNQGLINANIESAIIATLPIIAGTRDDVPNNTQIDAQEFANELSKLTGDFIKQSENNANAIPDEIWEEAESNEMDGI